MNTFCTFQILDQAPRRRDRGEVAFDLVRDLWHQLRRGQVPKDRGRVERRTPILRQIIFFLNLKRSPINAPCQQLNTVAAALLISALARLPPVIKKISLLDLLVSFFRRPLLLPLSTSGQHQQHLLIPLDLKRRGTIRYVCNGHRLRTGGGRAGSGSPPMHPHLGWATFVLAPHLLLSSSSLHMGGQSAPTHTRPSPKPAPSLLVTIPPLFFCSASTAVVVLNVAELYVKKKTVFQGKT